LHFSFSKEEKKKKKLIKKIHKQLVTMDTVWRKYVWDYKFQLLEFTL
jgi:Trm5-related predicted tRNA methylase